MKRFAASLMAGGAISAFWALGVVPAAAQEAASEEIVVTATKREANPQDIGIAITAFSGEDLRERRIDTVADLTESVANVELYEPTGGGVPVVVIRGVGLQDFRVNNTPTASFYVDEVYQPSVATTNQGMFDLQRIEVLKGPQGGLYGRNTTGGAIQLISARPQIGGHDGYAVAGIGSYDERNFEGAVNLPVSDQFALRVAGRAVQSDGGYTYNAVSGEEHGAQDRWSARVGALWAPNENVEIYANLHGGADQSETPLLRAVGAWIEGDTFAPGYVADAILLNYGGLGPGLGSLCAPLQAGVFDNTACATHPGVTPASLGLTSDPYASISSDINRLDNDWIGGVIVGEFDIGALTLTSVTGVDQLNYTRITDWDALAGVFEDVYYQSKIDAISQEFRLAGTSGAVDWLAGVNYSQDTLRENSVLLANLGLVPVGYGVTQVEQIYRQETTSWSVFGRADWSLSERTTLVGELRYTDETKTFTGGVNFPEFALQLFSVDTERSFDDFSGRAEIDFQQTRDLLWYASISRGFKSGGFFGGFATSAAELEPYDPETVTAYEVGVKSEWLEGRLRANVSLFYYDYRDLQGFSNITTGGGAQISLLSNIGDAEITGADIELAWSPIDDLTLQLNIGLLDGEISSSAEVGPDSYAIAQNWPLEGQRLANQSDVSINLFGRYEFDLAAQLRGSVQGGYAYRSDFNFDYVLIPQERPLYHEDGYGVANFRVGVGAPDGGWELAAWVDNAFDEVYRATSGSDSLGGFFELYGPPRTYGAALSLRW